MNHDNILCRFLRTLLFLFQSFFFFCIGCWRGKKADEEWLKSAFSSDGFRHCPHPVLPCTQNILLLGHREPTATSTPLPWVNENPCWYHDKNPKIHFNYFQIFQMSHCRLNQGLLSSNLTFFGLNMATKRPHSKQQRYQHVTLASHQLRKSFNELSWCWVSPW